MKTNERERFIATIARSCSGHPVHIVTRNATLILRHAKTHGRLAEMSCNGHPLQSVCPPQGCDLKAWNDRVKRAQEKHDAWIEKREAQIERRISELASEIGCKANFGGDPRGYTVKLILPGGEYNTWGGKEEGYGVPQ